MHGRVELKYLLGAALLAFLSFQRAQADPVGATLNDATNCASPFGIQQRKIRLNSHSLSVHRTSPCWKSAVAFDAPSADGGARPILAVVAMARAGYVVSSLGGRK